MLYILSLQDVWVSGLQAEEQVTAGALYLATVTLQHCIISTNIAQCAGSPAGLSRWWPRALLAPGGGGLDWTHSVHLKHQ